MYSFSQVLDHSIEIIVDGDYVTTKKSITVQINNSSQKWLGEIEIPFQESYEPQIHEAVIINRQGEIVRKLKKKEITTQSIRSSISFYEDNYQKKFNLYWNEYPYKIKYSYSISEDNFIQLAWWYPLIAYNTPHFNCSLTLNVPGGFSFFSYISPQFDESNSKTEEGRTIYQWSLTNGFFHEPQHHSPHWRQLYPNILLMPKEFNYAKKGSAESWETYGNWIYRLNENKDQLTFEEGQVVDQLTKGVVDQMEKVKILYNHLQSNTHYVNVSIEEGGLEPYPASYVSYNGYGDCKALTIYMKALLKHIGIPSYYCLVNAGINAPDVFTDYPSAQFNHVILAVPIGKDTVWLENTNQSIPFNYLGTFTQGRKALWVSENNSQLIATPKMTEEDLKEYGKFDFVLSDSGTSVTIRHLLGGEKFETYLSLSQIDNEEELIDFVRESIDIKDLEIIEYETLSTVENKVEINLKAKCYNQSRSVGNYKIISHPKVELPEINPVEKRHHPFKIPVVINRQIDTNISIHDSSSNSIEFPTNTSLSSQFGEYEILYETDSRKIEIKERLHIYSQNYTKTEYLKFCEFINKVSSVQNKSSILLK
ncbi:DUF3857 domain-containing transglutaminase family protein [Ekhidna sp.]|uniref:DUF3857 domain-containing transglutaminase family protein n=1 Tax=Ekhidna sp. TaxID=2608089 RepID=UPI003B50B05D